MSDRTGGEGIIGSNFFFKMIRPQQHEVSITSAALNGFLVKKKTSCGGVQGSSEMIHAGND